MRLQIVWIAVCAILVSGANTADTSELVQDVPAQNVDQKVDREYPSENEGRTIYNNTSLHFDTELGGTHTIVINQYDFVSQESCHVKTPTGLQYDIKEGFNVPGVEIVNGSNIECGIKVTVLSEDMIGEWTLILRAIRFSDPIERRQDFTIKVEEFVEAFPKEITISEGNDLYLRLRNPTEQYESCELVGPNENKNSAHEIDVIHNESCGFVIKNVTEADGGKWEIVYGKTIVYKATVDVTVIARTLTQANDLILIQDRQVNQEIGASDAVYCRLMDPQGFTVFEGFGRCQLVLERVTMAHNGYWKMNIGLPGKVLVEEYSFWVAVKEGDARAVVTTRVFRERPDVILSCSVSSEYKVRACKFRDPSGAILIASHGVGQDRFIFHGSQEVSYNSEAHTHECGLRITNPMVSDLGLWRCAIDTEDDTHYGFLPASCPWLMQDPEVAASVVLEPTLKADRAVVSAVAGDSVAMSCSVQSPIRYCYFRAQNGTVYNVAPGTPSSDVEYVGSGFDSGECGIRFKNLFSTDSGRWTCHVGLVDKSEAEQRDLFQVAIQEEMTVRHYWNENDWLMVEGVVHSGRPLEYCRFVRIDGFGFTTDKVPAGYTSLSSLENGRCMLHMVEPTILNLHPWTVVAKVRGHDAEISRLARGGLMRFEPESSGSSIPVYFWIVIALISVTILLVGVSLVPKNNRKWTYNKASEFRNSIRDSFRKPKPEETV